MMIERAVAESECRVAFVEFLDEVGDVMQLYYGGALDYAKATTRIGAALRAMHQSQARTIAELGRRRP